MSNAVPKRILVPVDLSDSSRSGAMHAAALAVRVGASVELLHAWRVPSAVAELSDWWPTLSEEERLGQSLTSYVSSAREGPLAALAVAVRDAGVADVVTRLEEGHAARVILDRAPLFDLVVMGRHGRSAIAHFLIGSVAERVARRCKVPVLLVPRTDAGG